MGISAHDNLPPWDESGNPRWFISSVCFTAYVEEGFVPGVPLPASVPFGAREQKAQSRLVRNLCFGKSLDPRALFCHDKRKGLSAPHVENVANEVKHEPSHLSLDPSVARWIRAEERPFSSLILSTASLLLWGRIFGVLQGWREPQRQRHD